MYDLRSISKSLQDAAKEILEAKKPIHPNQQKIDVHEPEKDEINAKDFEMLRAGKKTKMKEDVEELEELKMSTLRSYVDKAKAENLPGKGGNRGVALLTPGTRDKGVHRAVERMRKMKEDIDLEDDTDEILLATPI